ncbi:MAG: flavodoxin, partial [Thermoplasmata archaeon]
LGYPLKKIYQPVVAKGELDEDTLKKCEDLGKTIAAGCEAGIY